MVEIKTAIENLRGIKSARFGTITEETTETVVNIVLEDCESLDLAISALEKQLNSGWIPISERLPVCEKEILILTERNEITTAIYEDGQMPEDESMWNWYEVDFDYDAENDINYVPKGWWEYRHFNSDDVYNNAVDEKVIAWQPLPEPCKEDKCTFLQKKSGKD